MYYTVAEIWNLGERSGLEVECLVVVGNVWNIEVGIVEGIVDGIANLKGLGECSCCSQDPVVNYPISFASL